MSKPSYYGYTMPFASRAGFVPFQADERIIKNDLLILLNTIPGQRVMQPTFGTPINQYIFEQLDEESLSLMRTAIVDAIREYEPRVAIVSLDVLEGSTSNLLNIKLVVRILKESNRTVELNIILNPAGNANGR